MNQAKYQVQGATDSMIDTVKANPVPAAMAAIGIGWLLFARRDNGRHYRGSGDYDDYRRYTWRPGAMGGYVPTQDTGTYQPAHWQPGAARSGQGRQGEQYWQDARHPESGRPDMGELRDRAAGTLSDAQRQAGETISRAQDAAGDAMETAQQMAGQAVENVQQFAGQSMENAQQMMGQWGDQAQYYRRQAGWQFDRMLRENPLALGVVALGLGAALAMLVPETRAEHELMGETRERLANQAGQALQEQLGQAQEIAKRATEGAREAVESSVRETMREEQSQSPGNGHSVGTGSRSSTGQQS